MCVYYRRINKLQPEVTKADSGKGCISLIPLPKIDELYAKLKVYKVFSSLDLRSGYCHIGLTKSAKPKSAFVLTSLSKYQFNRIPFRLAQAPAYFQKLINDVLKGQHHHLQQVRKRTFRTLRRNFHQAKSGRTQTQTPKMLLLQETHTIPWTLNISRRNPTTPQET